MIKHYNGCVVEVKEKILDTHRKCDYGLKIRVLSLSIYVKKTERYQDSKEESMSDEDVEVSSY
eukprot:10820172-Ditylum_brightwellii.AAC.1